MTEQTLHVSGIEHTTIGITAHGQLNTEGNPQTTIHVGRKTEYTSGISVQKVIGKIPGSKKDQQELLLNDDAKAFLGKTTLEFGDKVPKDKITTFNSALQKARENNH